MGDFAGYIYNYKNGIHAGLGVSILSEQGKGVSSYWYLVTQYLVKQ